jgi:hypothetical protein
MEQRNGHRGFALPAAIGAIVIVGVLVTAGFYMAQQEMRISVATENASLAFYMAEMGAAEVMDNWNNDDMEARALFADTTIVDTVGAGNWSVVVRRTGTQMYFLDATGEITERGGMLYSGATRRIGIIARHLELGMEPPAALTTKNGLKFGGAPPTIVGTDSNPTGWGMCGVANDDTYGFMSYDTVNVSAGKGKSTHPCDTYIDGSPYCFDADTAAIDETYEPFEDAAYWDYLRDIADHELSAEPSPVGPVDDGTTCDVTVPGNWGDPGSPNAPCGGYFPIIFFDQSVTLASNSFGQGILLVDGDLNMGGVVTYYGIVIVRGQLNVSGTVQINGALIAYSTGNFVGTMDIQYSACTIERAITENANVTRVRPLTRRSFVDLSNLIN